MSLQELVHKASKETQSKIALEKLQRDLIELEQFQRYWKRVRRKLFWKGLTLRLGKSVFSLSFSRTNLDESFVQEEEFRVVYEAERLGLEVVGKDLNDAYSVYYFVKRKKSEV